MDSSPARPAPLDIALLGLRLAVGAVFVYHGYGKVFGGIDGFAANLEKMNVPMPVVSAWLAALSEFVGGIFFVAGVLSRFWSIPMIAVMVVAIIKVHGSAYGMQHGGMEYNLVLISVLLTVLLVGPGRLALISLIKGPGASRSLLA